MSTSLEFSKPSFTRPMRTPRTPEQQEAARNRFMNSPAFQARVQVEKERLQGKQRDREANQAQFDQAKQLRLQARQKDNLGPDMAEFAKRGYDNLGNHREGVAKEIGTAMTAMASAAPNLWQNSEPARTMLVAHRSMQEYVAGKIDNGALHNAVKDMAHANAPTIADRKTGEVVPEREAARQAWDVAVKASDKVLEAIQTADRSVTKAGPQKSPDRGR